MRFSEECYGLARPIWDAQLAHPFVRGIGDGGLEEERFRRWVLQDYRYLKESARVLAWAVAKSDDLAAMGWYAGVLNLTLNVEMDLHRRYADRFGITGPELEAAPMWPTTRAYTDFLVRTAADGEMAELVAALLPCAWGYVHVAKELTKNEPPSDQRYAEWIAQYASAEFEAVADWLKAELDRLVEEAGAGRRERLKELFLLSSRYELAFWQMCWAGESWCPESGIRTVSRMDLAGEVKARGGGDADAHR